MFATNGQTALMLSFIGHNLSKPSEIGQGTSMKYRVVDNEFNRANYKGMIGQVLDKPPAYAVVETTTPLDPKSYTERHDRCSKEQLTHSKNVIGTPN